MQKGQDTPRVTTLRLDRGSEIGGTDSGEEHFETERSTIMPTASTAAIVLCTYILLARVSHALSFRVPLETTSRLDIGSCSFSVPSSPRAIDMRKCELAVSFCAPDSRLSLTTHVPSEGDDGEMLLLWVTPTGFLTVELSATKLRINTDSETPDVYRHDATRFGGWATVDMVVDYQGRVLTIGINDAQPVRVPLPSKLTERRGLTMCSVPSSNASLSEVNKLSAAVAVSSLAARDTWDCPLRDVGSPSKLQWNTVSSGGVAIEHLVGEYDLRVTIPDKEAVRCQLRSEQGVPVRCDPLVLDARVCNREDRCDSVASAVDFAACAL